MFNNADQRAKVLIDIALIDGRRLKGNLLMMPTSTLQRTINNDTLFIEFEDLDGVLHMIAKRAVVEVVGTALPKAAKLENKSDAQNAPHKTLGLAPEASSAEIEAAYASLMQMHDAAAYSGINLPEEISRYLEVRRNNIKAAYDFLTGSQAGKAA